MAHLRNKLVRVKVRLELAELHVSCGLGLPILLEGARLVVHLPGLLAEEEHVFRRFYQSFID